MLTKFLIKQLHSQKQICKDWKKLVALGRRWCCCWWSLLTEMLNKHLYVIRSLSYGKKVHYSIICGSLPPKKFCYQLSQWKCHWLYQKEYWSPNFCDLNLLDYAIWDIMKKILYKNLKRYEDIKGLSVSIPYAWDRLKKISIIQSTNGGCD